MHKASKEEETIQNKTIQKVNDILNQPNEQDWPDETIIKHIVRLLFTDDEKLTHIVFPDIKKENENEFNLVNKSIDLLTILFKLPSGERKNINKININLIDNLEIINIVKYITKILDNIKCIKNGSSNLDKLYKIVFELFSKQKKETLGALIDKIVAKIGYIVCSTKILSYILFCLLTKKYLRNDNIKEINSTDNNINLNNDVCIKLSIDILNGKIKNNLVIYSSIVIKFDWVKELLKEYDLKILEKASSNTELIISQNNSKKNIKEIVDIFIKEYNKILLYNIKNNAIKIEVKGEKNEKEEKENNIKNNQFDLEKNIINFSSPNLSNSYNRKENNINIYWGELINILKKIKMEPDQFNELINIIKKLENSYNENSIKISKLEEDKNENSIKILKLEKDKNENSIKISKLEKDKNENSIKISKLEEDKNELKSRLEIAQKKISGLETDKNEMKKEMNAIKSVIYNIQLKKNAEMFLKSFNSVLELKDYFLLGNSKNEIIIKRIKEKYKDYVDTEKFILLQNLINKTVNLIKDDDNQFANSLLKEKYQKDLEEYKIRKNIIIRHQFFYFLKGIGLKENFDESYSFLNKYYLDDFIPINNNDDMLNNYFKDY